MKKQSFTVSDLNCGTIRIKKSRILIVDDDPDVVIFLKTILAEFPNLQVFTARDPFETIDILSQHVVDMIFLDWSLPGITGPDTLLKIEKLLGSDLDAPSEWDSKKAKVYLYTTREKETCKIQSSKYFEYCGYINKQSRDMDPILKSILS